MSVFVCVCVCFMGGGDIILVCSGTLPSHWGIRDQGMVRWPKAVLVRATVGMGPGHWGKQPVIGQVGRSDEHHLGALQHLYQHHLVSPIEGLTRPAQVISQRNQPC